MIFEYITVYMRGEVFTSFLLEGRGKNMDEMVTRLLANSFDIKKNVYIDWYKKPFIILKI